MLVAKIDKDYLSNESTDGFNRVGHEFNVLNDLSADTPKVRFRCLDDDGIVYYVGWLLNDPAGEVQLKVLRWCLSDAGCTKILVYVGEEWVAEIG